MSNHLLKCPPQLRAVQHYLKLAVDYEARQPVITYWGMIVFYHYRFIERDVVSLAS